jgi:Bacterial regulatory proteins, tetR family
MARGNVRDEILPVAAQLFATTGYNGASVQAIANAAGCSKAARHLAGSRSCWPVGPLIPRRPSAPRS